MESKSTGYFNKVILAFAKHYREVFEARDLLEDELLKFLKIIQDNPELNKLKKWKWGWDCGNNDDEYENYDEFVKDKPFFIDNKSRVYLFDYDNKNENYYALFGFGFDLEKNGGEMVFFTSIAAQNGSKTELKDLKGFKPQTLYHGEYILYDCNMSIEELTLGTAIVKVNKLIDAWSGFKSKKGKN